MSQIAALILLQNSDILRKATIYRRTLRVGDYPFPIKTPQKTRDC